MKLITTPRRQVVRQLADEFLHNYAKGRTIIAVDGTDDSGRTSFADDLAEVFAEREHPVFRASLHYFRLPRATQEEFGPDTAERRYRHGYDYDALRRVLIAPFKLGGSAAFVTQQLDPDRGTWIEPTWLSAPADATLIIDGEFVNRAELRDVWNWSLLVEGTPDNASDAERIYRAEETPTGRAAVVIDNRDPEHPSRRFFDSC